MASESEKSTPVIGLEDRLRTVDGVASIRVELGDEGVDAIKVEVTPGADEAGVLEEIRQVLVAYGLRSRRPGWKLGSRRTSPAIVASVSGGPPTTGSSEQPTLVADQDRLTEPTAILDLTDAADGPSTGAPAQADVDPGDGPEEPTVKVLQGGKGLIISVSANGRSVEASSDISPIGAAEAMAKVVADFHDLQRPDRVAVVMHELDGERVVTLLMRRDGESALAAELAQPMLHDALYRATLTTLKRLGPGRNR